MVDPTPWLHLISSADVSHSPLRAPKVVEPQAGIAPAFYVCCPPVLLLDY